MESIIYNIDNAYFPVTVTLKEGETTIATNTHIIAGEYGFDDIVDGQYTVNVVDAFGCETFANVPEVATTLPD